MKRLHCLFFLFVTALPFYAFAQEKPKQDSLLTHKVMLISYDPRYYLSDADRDIMEQSNMDPNTFRSNFRHNLDRHIQREIGLSYPCISLLNDTADALQETMNKVMGRTGFRYEKAIPITPKPIKGDPGSGKIRSSNTKDHEDSKTASQYIPVEKDALYMQAIITKPVDLFTELYKQYQTDIFVFVTQFEIKTNYKSCLDIANKIYKREVMVHFTVYDKDGKILAGSYATSYFPSDSNHANKIIGDCFPELARYIAGCLP